MTDKTALDKEATLALPRLATGLWADKDYLPIEAFRGSLAQQIFRGDAIARSFLSSGTTGQTRARSAFSEAGLLAYRSQCLQSFLTVLEQALPAGATRPVGISLIPKPSTAGWEDSSLAQMLAWIAEVMPVIYCDAADLKAVLRAQTDEPLWLFGTAFHWINALDSGQAAPLPQASVLFETGGTKGKTREVSRAELFRGLASAFQIPEEAVVSEYGMSELACQAYDFVPKGRRVELTARRFAFPPQVQIAALTGPSLAKREGQGALIVFDPKRHDYPWPIRTEDLADVHGQTFKLLGRAAISPLKGCSLLAEDSISQQADLPASLSAESHPTVGRPDRVAVRGLAAERSRPLDTFLNTFLAMGRTVDLLTNELGSRAAALAAIADIAAAIPRQNEDGSAAWADAAERALGSGPIVNQWLLILPENHSLVGLHPLVIAYLLNLDIKIRIPKSFSGNSLITSFAKELSSLPGARIELVDASVRLQASSPPLTGPHVLAFGGDDTISNLSSMVGHRLRGFGHRLGVSAVTALAANELLAPLVKDALSLGQNGCTASRLVLLTGPGHPELIATGLQQAAAAFWGQPIPWRHRVGLDIEAFRLASAGARLWLPVSRSHPLVAYFHLTDLEELTERLVARSVAQAPFTIPLLHVEGTTPTRALEVVLKHFAASRTQVTATLPEPYLSEVRCNHQALAAHGGQLRPLGTANTLPWDGTHEGKALYEESLNRPLPS